MVLTARLERNVASWLMTEIITKSEGQSLFGPRSNPSRQKKKKKKRRAWPERFHDRVRDFSQGTVQHRVVPCIILQRARSFLALFRLSAELGKVYDEVEQAAQKSWPNSKSHNFENCRQGPADGRCCRGVCDQIGWCWEVRIGHSQESQRALCSQPVVGDNRAARHASSNAAKPGHDEA